MSCDFLALAKEGIRTMKPYQPGKPVEELQRELGLENIIKLASNENPLGPSSEVKNVIAQHLDALTRYPDGSHFSIRQALADKLALKADQITLGNGSNDVLNLVGQCFLDASVSAIYSEHAFIVYPLMIKAQGARAIKVPAKEWGHDLDAMASAIAPDTRVIFIANPNNPTGTWIDFATIKGFLQKVPSDVLVVLDEAYFEYIADAPSKDCLQLLAAFDNLLITRTFSKAYGLAGLRIGYSLSSASLAAILQTAREPFNVNSLAQVAAIAALDDQDYLQRSVALNQQGLQQLAEGFKALGFDYIPSKGNFISFDTGEGSVALYQSLLASGVIVRPIGVYDLPNHLRVSTGRYEENARFLTSLKQITNR